MPSELLNYSRENELILVLFGMSQSRDPGGSYGAEVIGLETLHRVIVTYIYRK